MSGFLSKATVDVVADQTSFRDGRKEPEEDEKERERRSRGQLRLIKHAVAGAVMFFWFYVLLGIQLFPMVQGMILESTIFMAMVGAVAGLVISWTGRGRFGGIFVGVVLFTVFMFITLLVTDSYEDRWLPFILCIGPIGGGLPGALIGYHVEMDV